MSYNRILRLLVCLALVCCILVNASPIKAEASAASGAAIIKASTVTCNPAVVVGAALIALGVWAGTNPDEFRNVVNNAVSFLETAGGWIVDGSMELLRTVSEAGTYGYYVTADFLETMRSWLFSENIIAVNPSYGSPSSGMAVGAGSPVSVPWPSHNYTVSASADCDVILFYHYKKITSTSESIAAYIYFISESSFTVTNSTGTLNKDSSFSVGSGNTAYLQAAYTYDIGSAELLKYKANLAGYYDVTSIWNGSLSTALDYCISQGALGDDRKVLTDYDLTLGYVSEAAIDLGFDDEEAAAYNRSQLRVIEGGGSDPDDDNDPVIYFPIIPGEYSEIEEMTQEDQWNGTAPEEFPDSTTTEEFEIIDQPEIDGFQGIEIQPVIDPDTGTDTDPTTAPDSGSDTDPTTAPDSGSNPDNDSEGGTSSGSQIDYTSWLQRILTAILELPSKFETWISDCKTAIEELPSKFSEFFTGLKTTIEGIPDAILNGIQNLFTPSETFIESKVEALKAKYTFLDPMISTGDDLKSFFQNIGTKPPIIYIDLGAGTGWYPMGGKVAFIDLTWYEEYKPTVDNIIGAFLWLWLAWRLLQSLPGIVRGDSGFWGTPDPHPDAGFHLPEGVSVRRIGSGNKLKDGGD